MDKETLKKIVISQAQNEMALPKPLIVREAYDYLKRFVNIPQVIILSGVRRCGKSTWMKMIREHASEPDYYLNFDDERLASFQLDDCQRLVEVFIELYGVQKTFYFDEIQSLNGWERFVRRLHNEEKKVFITGSNTDLLSRQFGTHLTGRNIALHLFPYSFREYIQKQNESLLKEKHLGGTKIAVIKKYFAEFRVLGGFPEYLRHGRKEYLQELYENILYKDVIICNSISDPNAIKNLAYYLASNNTKEFTYNSLRKLFNITGNNTVSQYCHYLAESFLCFIVERFAYSVKTQTFSPKKIYFIDQALAECVGFRMSEDRGRVLENIVFLQLLRKNYEVYYHKEKKECDFVTRDGFYVGHAIQVCESLQDAKTKKREIAGLVDALHTYNLKEGFLITDDELGEEEIIHENKTYKIKICPAWKWLLDDLMPSRF